MRLLLVRAPHLQRVAEHLDAEHVVAAAARHPAFVNSSARITCSRRDSPAPPYSVGQPGEVSVLVERLTPLPHEALEILALELADALPVGREVLGQERLDLLPIRLGLG